jgi:16S rRNA (guanine966-N2)-methyltransferase
VRVIAGRFGGRVLSAPSGRATRPTGDRVREAVFSMLGPLDGTVLDLYAGTGALGIEALSRGAAFALFVDDGVEARGALRNALARAEAYDLVFLDPPYRLAAGLGDELGGALAGLLAPGARVVCESDRRTPLALELPRTHHRRYGDTVISIHTA